MAVVGAGPAGTTAAMLLAGHGFKVALIERGEYPGAKNMFGGALFGRVLENVVPEYWAKAPVERFINRRVISLLSHDSAVSLDLNSSNFKNPPYNGVVVMRTHFDRWYAQEAVNAGVTLITHTVVDDLIREGDQVVGVVARRGSGELRAKVVIAADGALSLLARKAGLRKDFVPKHFALGVKEVLYFPEGTLEERLGLSGDEGMSNEYVGRMGEGLHGGAFLYTNRNSMAAGVVVHLASLKSKRATIYDALDKFKRHPAVAPLLKDGKVLEYSAHLITEGGYTEIPEPCTGGLLVAGDAAGLVLNAGVFLEGVNFAIESGKIAAAAVVEAFEKGKFVARTLAGYKNRLKTSFVLQDLDRFKQVIPLLKNPRLYEIYPAFACRILEVWFSSGTTGHLKLSGIIKQLRKELGLDFLQLTKDGYQAWRGLV